MITTTKRFRRLVFGTLGVVYLLIIAGAVVRVTGSGLGCPDWPLCYGQVMPPPEVQAWIEHTHRLIAALFAPLFLFAAYKVWQNYRSITEIFVPVLLVFSLLAIQIPLGGIVVISGLEPLTVAVHLGNALLIFGAMIFLAAASYFRAPQHIEMTKVTIPQNYRRFLVIAMGCVFAMLMTGALVVGTQSSIACPDWPLCHGQIIPETQRGAFHMLHRGSVGLVSLLMVGVIVATLRLKEHVPGMQKWAALIGVLFVAQAAVGAIQVLLVLPTFWRAMHVALAAAVWGVLVTLWSLTVLASVTEPAEERVAAPAPAK